MVNERERKGGKIKIWKRERQRDREIRKNARARTGIERI